MNWDLKPVQWRLRIFIHKNISNKARNKSLNQKGTKLVGQTCFTGGAMKGADGEFLHHFVC